MTVLSASAVDNDATIALGSVGLGLGPMVVHGLHGNGGRGVASTLLLRPSIALLTVMAAFSSCDEGDCGYLIGGVAIASLLDAAMAYETVRVARSRPGAGSGWAWPGPSDLG